MVKVPGIPTELRILAIGLVLILLKLSSQPHRLSAAFEAASQALTKSQPAAAAAALQEAIELAPWRYDLYVPAGRYALEGQDYQAAIDLLEAGAQKGLLTNADWVSLGDAYLALENPDQALLTWKRALEAGGPPLELKQRILRIYQEKRDFPAILETLKQVSELQPEDGELVFRTGLYQAALDPEAALPYLERAAALDSQVSSQARHLQADIRSALLAEVPAFTLVSSGKSLASLGYWELSKEAFSKATLLQPDYAEAWAFLAEARQKVGGKEAAYAGQDLEKAAQLDKNSLAVNLLAALYWQRHGKVDRALTLLEELARNEPKNPVVQVELGNAYARLGDLENAEIAFKQAVALEPQDVSLRRALVNFLLRHQIQLHNEALPIARQAVILAPQDAAALDLLGETLFLLGDLHGSRRILERAIQVDPENAQALMHLGVNLLFLDERAKARQLLEQARQFAVDADTLDQAQRLLQYYFP